MRTFLRPLIPRMEFGVCLLRRCMPYSFFGLFLILSINLNGQRQSMNCFGQVNMSIPPSGQIPLVPKMVTGMTDLDNIIVYLAGRDEPILDCREANTEVQYFLRDTVENLECWGIILVEDKQEFEVVCNDGLVPCINGLASLNPGDFVTVIDNCLTLDDLTITYRDGSIALFPSPSDTIGEVLRTWILSDDSGFIRECNSIIYLDPLPCNSLIIPGDTTIYCGQDPRDFDLTGYLNYTEEQLLENCYIAVNTCIRDSFPFNCGSKVKYVRKWQISDWVTGTEKDTIQIIIVEDTTIATIFAPKSLPVVFHNCNPSLIIAPLDRIEQNCTDVSNSDISVFVNGGFIPYSIGDTAPVNIGSNGIIYTATNACFSRLVPDTINQEVLAPDRPMLVCDSTLNRAISMNFQDSIKVLVDTAFASADVTSCIPYRLLARKIDPICGTTSDTFMSYLEFCIEETVPKFLIELVAEDSMGRRSDTCEVWLDIQEKTPPTLSIIKDPVVELDTSGTFTLDSNIIIASYGDNSGCISNISVTGSRLGMAGSGAGMMSGSMSFLNSGVWTTFTCQDTGQYLVKVTVTDCSNNMTMDTTSLTVNSGGNCNGIVAPAYTGVVMAYGVEVMEGAILSATSDDIELVSITDVDGYFNIEIPVNGRNYSMSGLYPDEWKVGISANDLALMEEYIIGLRELDMYQVLSADVNNNGRITVLDVLTARKILLGIQEEVAELEPWIFRNSTTTELQSLESIDHGSLRRGGLDIHTMKRGDLDADAMGASIVRSVDEIVIEEIEPKNGQKSQFRLHLGDPSTQMALQTSIKILNGEGWHVIDQHRDVHTAINDNRIDILYYQHTDNSPLWVDIEGGLSADIDFSIVHHMEPRSWNYNKGVRSVVLKRAENESFTTVSNSQIQLSAHPNPIELMTTVTMEWNLENADESVAISLSDALGRTIYTSEIQLHGRAGYTSIPVELPYDPGLYILSAQTAEQSQQLKIVKN